MRDFVESVGKKIRFNVCFPGPSRKAKPASPIFDFKERILPQFAKILVGYAPQARGGAHVLRSFIPLCYLPYEECKKSMTNNFQLINALTNEQVEVL